METKITSQSKGLDGMWQTLKYLYFGKSGKSFRTSNPNFNVAHVNKNGIKHRNLYVYGYFCHAGLNNPQDFKKTYQDMSYPFRFRKKSDHYRIRRKDGWTAPGVYRSSTNIVLSFHSGDFNIHNTRDIAEMIKIGRLFAFKSFNYNYDFKRDRNGHVLRYKKKISKTGKVNLIRAKKNEPGRPIKIKNHNKHPIFIALQADNKNQTPHLHIIVAQVGFRNKSIPGWQYNIYRLRRIADECEKEFQQKHPNHPLTNMNDYSAEQPNPYQVKLLNKLGPILHKRSLTSKTKFRQACRKVGIRAIFYRKSKRHKKAGLVYKLKGSNRREKASNLSQCNSQVSLRNVMRLIKRNRIADAKRKRERIKQRKEQRKREKVQYLSNQAKQKSSISTAEVQSSIRANRSKSGIQKERPIKEFNSLESSVMAQSQKRYAMKSLSSVDEVFNFENSITNNSKTAEKKFAHEWVTSNRNNSIAHRNLRIHLNAIDKANYLSGTEIRSLANQNPNINPNVSTEFSIISNSSFAKSLAVNTLITKTVNKSNRERNLHYDQRKPNDKIIDRATNEIKNSTRTIQQSARTIKSTKQSLKKPNQQPQSGTQYQTAISQAAHYIIRSVKATYQKFRTAVRSISNKVTQMVKPKSKTDTKINHSEKKSGHHRYHSQNDYGSASNSLNQIKPRSKRPSGPEL